MSASSPYPAIQLLHRPPPRPWQGTSAPGLPAVYIYPRPFQCAVCISGFLCIYIYEILPPLYMPSPLFAYSYTQFLLGQLSLYIFSRLLYFAFLASLSRFYSLFPVVFSVCMYVWGSTSGGVLFGWRRAGFSLSSLVCMYVCVFCWFGGLYGCQALFSWYMLYFLDLWVYNIRRWPCFNIFFWRGGGWAIRTTRGSHNGFFMLHYQCFV